jgi:hypothetical protein
MTIFSIQYLEESPEIQNITAQAARERLQDAFQRLPITMVLLGWNLPERLIQACANECQKQGVALYRWHPLLTGDGTLMPQPAWQTIGLDGTPIAGFRNMPEFTFICPNRPAVQEAIRSHLTDLFDHRYFDGIFFDRMRYPSPAGDPEKTLGCFCDSCKAAAAQQGLDLTAAQHVIRELVSDTHGAQRFAQVLLEPNQGATGHPASDTVRAVLDFRTHSISKFIAQCADLARNYDCAIGLDGFAPVLTQAVGQDLKNLDRHADWIKIMSYGHTLGPAGLPFELLVLADWLIERHNLNESVVMACLSDASAISLPDNRTQLRKHGLASSALHDEALRARDKGVTTLLAGIELVEIPGVAELNPTQIKNDLQAFRQAGADGLALSWDLWMMPLDRLDLVRTVWNE